MSDLLELTARAEPTHFWFHGFRGYVAPLIQRIAGGRRDLRIIDCGCGTGYNLRTSAAAVRPDVRRSISTPTPCGGRARQGRPLVRADIERIPFRSDTFDLATSFDVVQSVPDDRAALREDGAGAAAGRIRGAERDRAGPAAGRSQRRLGRAAPLQHGDGAARLLGRRRSRGRRASAYLFASLVPLMLAVRKAQAMLRPFREPTGDEDLAVPSTPVNAR